MTHRGNLRSCARSRSHRFPLVPKDTPKGRTWRPEKRFELPVRGGRRPGEIESAVLPVAEAVGFVVCSAVGLDTNTSSSDYIQIFGLAIDAQDKVAAHAGHHATVKGTVEGDTLKLESIEMAPAAK